MNENINQPLEKTMPSMSVLHYGNERLNRENEITNESMITRKEPDEFTTKAQGGNF
jgi:hypothetical protein